MKITLTKEEALLILAKHVHVSKEHVFGSVAIIQDLWLQHGLFDVYFDDPKVIEVWFDELGIGRRYWDIVHESIHEDYLKRSLSSICDCFEPSFIP